ncbi:MAG: hypothetical protein JRE81_13705 [Deltaproteobacteria bacterium]|jgi:amidase|nr:hypothetical protein [Deltaproteobacteria bacterium]
MNRVWCAQHSLALFHLGCLLALGCSSSDGSGEGSNEPDVFDSASSLARAIQAGDIKPSELLELYLARVDEHNPELNAIVALDVEGARARAREADEVLERGESWGPLHGVPCTVKDTVNLAGLPTTIGSPDYADFIPDDSADAVQRLIDAGAIVFGKTNTPELAGDWQTYNDVYGTTNNPWDLARTPGGSSGGSAVALAAGLSACELGGDLAGSLRVPAHFTGVYSHMPTVGLIPMEGHFSRFAVPAPPDPPGFILGTLGPMARSADDLGLLFGILADSEAASLPAARGDALSDYRVGAWIDDPGLETDTEVLDVLEDLVAQLRDAGATVDMVAPIDDLEQLAVDHRRLRFAITGRLPLPEEELDALLADRESVQQDWSAFFEDYDVLLVPPAPVVAIEHDQAGFALTRTITVNGEEIAYQSLDVWASVAGYADLPVTTAPLGLSSAGLPVAVQIIGPNMEDRTPIDFAQKLAELTGGFQSPPNY